jgi:hypothetical protein
MPARGEVKYPKACLRISEGQVCATGGVDEVSICDEKGDD